MPVLVCRERLALARIAERIRRPAIGGLEIVAVDALDILATAIANIAILLNPRAIALGGPLWVAPTFVDGIGTPLRRLVLDPPDVFTRTHAPLQGASFDAHWPARAMLGF